MTLTQETPLLDYRHPDLQALIAKRGWAGLPEFDRIGAVYNFVRDEIKFGYNRTDAIPASEVLADGFGQCNTKGILLMALLRALGIACRVRGLAIHKNLQRGVMPDFLFPIVPESIIHSWVEIGFQGRWIKLEGYILDRAYLEQLQRAFGESSPKLCGYGAGLDNINTPPVDWQGQDTFVQITGVNRDYGIFETPDAFYADHGQDFSWLKRVFYEKILRHWMNRRVARIRSGGTPPALPTFGYQAKTPTTITDELS